MYIPIVDTGHGGMIDGVYQDLASKRTPPDPKQFTFSQSNITAYEGVMNRRIGSKYEFELQKIDRELFSLTTHIQQDITLSTRIGKINKLVKDYPNKKFFLISIHCDKLTEDIKGLGNKAKGGHIIIGKSVYKGKNRVENYIKSKEIANIFSNVFKKEAKNWRGIHERDNIAMVNQPNCPSILIECGFYDNYDESTWLNSQEGIDFISNLLVKSTIQL